MLFLFQRLKMALITTRFSLKEKKTPFQRCSPIQNQMTIVFALM